MNSAFNLRDITIYRLFLPKKVSRVLALDFGKKRTGVAVTDELQLIASGLTTVNTSELVGFLTDYMNRESVSCIVVGEPKQMDNTPSESEAMIQPLINRLRKLFPKVTLARQDERFTSKMAVQSMIAGGMKKRKRQNKALVDEISATLILQAYINRL